MTELDFDTVEALGLDGTGRSVTDGRWPYTLENLTDQEFLLLLFLSSQAESYPDEAEAPQTGLWHDACNTQAEERYGMDGVENLARYVTGSHASIEDCIRIAREESGTFLEIMSGG
jgi:hypothetical protein